MLRSLVARLRSWWRVEDAEDRIDGDGGAYLDPAYNSRYTAERHLEAASNLDVEHDDGPPEDR